MADERLRLQAEVVDNASGPLRRIREQIAGVQATPQMKALQNDFKSLREHTTGLSKDAAGLTSSFGGIGIASLAASISVGAVIASFKGLASRTADLRNLSRETGLSADAINTLEHAAADFNVTQDTVAKGLSAWADKSFDFKRGIGELRAELNAQFPDVSKRMDFETPAQQLKELERLLAGMSNDPVRQQRWAELIFGNKEMARLFAQGGKAFDDSIASAEARVGKITPDMIASAAAFTKSVNAFNDSLDALETKVGPFVFKNLEHAISEFKDVFDQIKGAADFFQQNKDHPVAATGSVVKDWLTDQEKINEARRKAGDGPDYDVPGFLLDPAGKIGGKADEIRKRWDNRRSGKEPWFGWGLNPFQSDSPAAQLDPSAIHKSAFRGVQDALLQKASFTDRSSSPALGGGSGLQDIIQRGTRLGVVQGLMDFSTQKDAENRVTSSGGSGIQSARYEEWDGASGIGISGGNGSSAPGGSGGRFGRYSAQGKSAVAAATKRFPGKHAVDEPVDPAGTTGDASKNPILNEIAAAEGTTKRGYSDSFGHQVDGDLTGKTLREIEQIQRRMHGSTAIGRYQFMHDTLFGRGRNPGLMQQLGISPDEKFSPEIQERMGEALLRRRGYNRWKSGAMSDQDFMANLAKEWAGLTDPRTGHGFYPGQNTGHSVASQMAALKRERDRLANREDEGKGHEAGLPHRQRSGASGQAAFGPQQAPLPDLENVPTTSRPDLWSLQKGAGMAGQHTVKTEGGFHGTIELKGLPPVGRTNVRLNGLMESVKIKRGPTMTVPDIEA